MQPDLYSLKIPILSSNNYLEGTTLTTKDLELLSSHKGVIIYH